MKKAHPAARYHLKQILVTGVTYIVAIVCLYLLDTQTDAPTWAIVAVGVVLATVPLLAVELGDLNRPSPRCDVEVQATLLATATANIGDMDVGSEQTYDTLYRFSYEYQGKTYKKTIRVHSVQGKPRDPFTVLICSEHPQRCYIVLVK